jgi:hypothetical protein
MELTPLSNRTETTEPLKSRRWSDTLWFQQNQWTSKVRLILFYKNPITDQVIQHGKRISHGFTGDEEDIYPKSEYTIASSSIDSGSLPAH